jgi:hypothetical protein
MPSDTFAEVRVDPKKLRFIAGGTLPANDDRQNIDHFKENGYCTLLQISDSYGCLVYAKNDCLYVHENKTLLNLVNNKEEGLKIKMPNQVEFLCISDDLLFVQHGRLL